MPGPPGPLQGFMGNRGNVRQEGAGDGQGKRQSPSLTLTERFSESLCDFQIRCPLIFKAKMHPILGGNTILKGSFEILRR